MSTPLDVRTDPKGMAKRLRAALADLDVGLSHGQCLELVARALGTRDWNTLAATLAADPPGTVGAIPILRVFDTDRAASFYCGYLGFGQDWEHRFGPHHPRYSQVSRGGAKLHLSEHHGDASPGAAVLVTVRDVRSLHAELRSAGENAGSLAPGVEEEDWGLTLTVIDPFHNRIVFHQPRSDGPSRVAGSPAPIRHTLEVPCTPDEAFEAFAVRMGEWWHPDYSRDPAGFAGIRVEPEVGGVVAMRYLDGSEEPWGRVTAWEPGTRYGQSFWLAHDRDHPSRIEVRFSEADGGCRVAFEHGGWTAGNAVMRDHFTDWPKLLDRFVQLVSR